MRGVSGQAGLTLLEVLVAAVMLGLVAAAVFGQFTVGSRLDAQADKHLEAIRLAESVLERQKAARYDAVRSFEEGYGDYRIQVVVDEHIGSKTVTVIVSYQERERQKAVSLTMERGWR